MPSKMGRRELGVLISVLVDMVSILICEVFD